MCDLTLEGEVALVMQERVWGNQEGSTEIRIGPHCEMPPIPKGH